MDRPSPSTFHRTDRLLLTGALLLNLALKLAWLGVNELAHDEPFMVFWSQRPWPELWAMFRTENNPPLYFALIKGWSHCVPFEAAWLRVPSAVFSALVVWPLYRLAHRTGGRPTALLATALFTFSNYHYGFAHEVRAYSLFTLLAATGMWLLVRAADRPSAGRAMLQLTVVNTALVYTHFFGWFAVGLQGLLVLLVPDLRALRHGLLRSALITAGCYLPYATIFLARLGTSVSQGTWVEPPVPEELYNMVWRWSNAPVLAVLFLVVIAFAVRRSKAKDLGLRMSLTWTFVPLLGMFAVSFAVPMFLDRYLVYAAPGFALLVALSMRAVTRDPRVSTGLSAVAVLGMAATFTPWKDTGRHPSRVVMRVREWQAGPVIIQPPWYDLTFLYASDNHECFTLPGAERTFCMGKGSMWTTEDAASLPIDPAVEEQVVLVDAGAQLVDPSGSVKAALRAALPKVDSVEADHRVWVYRFRR